MKRFPSTDHETRNVQRLLSRIAGSRNYVDLGVGRGWLVFQIEMNGN